MVPSRFGPVSYTHLWEKLDEICNALPDDYDFTNFDEAAFIRSSNALTEAEKEMLLADIKELNGLCLLYTSSETGQNALFGL